jgi:hypothetical protein
MRQSARKQTKRAGKNAVELCILVFLTAGLIFCIVPIRTHAIWFDPANPQPRQTLWGMLSSMCLTPGTVTIIALIIAAATAIGFRIVRSAWTSSTKSSAFGPTASKGRHSAFAPLADVDRVSLASRLQTSAERGSDA